MSHARNFNCLIVVAAIILVAAGADTAFLLLHRPVVAESVAARTLVAPEVSRPMTADTSVAAHPPTEPQEVKSSMYRAGACGLPSICRRAGSARSTVRERTDSLH